MKENELNVELASGGKSNDAFDYNWRNHSRLEIDAKEITDYDATVDTLDDEFILAESNKQYGTNCPGNNPTTHMCFYSRDTPMPLPVTKPKAFDL